MTDSLTFILAIFTSLPSFKDFVELEIIFLSFTVTSAR